MSPVPPPPVRVTASAFDFKFFGPVQSALTGGGAVLRKDRWAGIDDHDEARSHELAAWADVLFAEWCLANAVFASRVRRDDQRLVVHFHRFEHDRDFPFRVDIDRVDVVAFAGPHFRDAAIERFGWPAERCVWLPNSVDVDRFETRKSPAASRTLGMIGWHRELKRLDRALDLLGLLRADDPRWVLRCKGEHPHEVDWVWHDRSERAYFDRVLGRIADDADLADGVIFDGFGPVNAWLADVGWILSPSDVESFHLGAAEGMASAAVPVIWEREGAGQVFPDRWIHPDTASAAAAIADREEPDRAREGASARAFVAERYDAPAIASAWRRLVLGA